MWFLQSFKKNILKMFDEIKNTDMPATQIVILVVYQ